MQDQLNKIIEVKGLLLDLHKSGVLSIATIEYYFKELNEKFDLIYNQLNNSK